MGDKGSAGGRFPAGPWQWQWRHQNRRSRRRRRTVGCFLWLATLLLVLLVLSLLFGGFNRGTKDGGQARLVPVTTAGAVRISASSPHPNSRTRGSRGRASIATPSAPGRPKAASS
jgi:hypothetical protein